MERKTLTESVGRSLLKYLRYFNEEKSNVLSPLHIARVLRFFYRFK